MKSGKARLCQVACRYCHFNLRTVEFNRVCILCFKEGMTFPILLLSNYLSSCIPYIVVWYFYLFTYTAVSSVAIIKAVIKFFVK